MAGARQAAGLRLLRNERGATLMVVLVMVVVMGLMAGMTGTSWTTVMQRAKEEELLFRGDQYRRAIESYYQAKHGSAAGAFPQNLEALLKDPRALQSVRHLRRLYSDPMTGGDWVLIKDVGGRIKGVKSASDLEPFKKDGFATVYESFRGAAKYSDWEFVYEPPAIQKAPPPPTPLPPGKKGADPVQQ
jgi:type II secretory pathway pseudopilin PulG